MEINLAIKIAITELMALIKNMIYSLFERDVSVGGIVAQSVERLIFH